MTTTERRTAASLYISIPAQPATRPSNSSTQNESMYSAIAIGGSHSPLSRSAMEVMSCGSAARSVEPTSHRPQDAHALFDWRVRGEEVIEEALVSFQRVANV